MAKRRKVGPTPDDLKKLSQDIVAFWETARWIAGEILVRRHLEDRAPQEVLEAINRQLAAAEKIWKRDDLLVWFDRSYSASHDELQLLEGEYTSYHQRALKLSHGFLMQLLHQRHERVPVPEFIEYVPPDSLSELDLTVAAHSAELYRDQLLHNVCWEELMAETAAAANLLARTTGEIPEEFRTKVLSKKKAAALLGRPNPDSGVRWLNDCIERGTIRCQQLSRQACVFDFRQFPESVRDQITRAK